MTPHEYLTQQAKNVEQALSETLRYDYGPKPTWNYYQECCERLERIKIAIGGTSVSDLFGINARLEELTNLSLWISLIERSRLGEFSWPFAEALRKMAETLLAETGLSGAKIPPIVHIVSDGEGYFIHYERTSPSGKHKFAFIAFPRPLKHHVLLHSLFGHELGHTALHTVGAGTILQNEVMKALQSSGPLSSNATMTSWLHNNAAPAEIKRELRQYQSMSGTRYSMIEYYRLKWLDELICDLFGLLLFGPGFAAAHQVFLRPIQPNPYEFGPADPTHPPYAIRHRMLVRTMQLIGWQTPVATQQPLLQAEQDLLDYISLDRFDAWSTILSDDQLLLAVAGVQKVFAAYGALAYVPPDEYTLSHLVRQLTMRLPPIIAGLTNRGAPELREVDIAHTLYAGWVYSIGHSRLTSEPLSFLETNMLCDHALLQQSAINIAIAKKMK
jgi:hypothetical protein